MTVEALMTQSVTLRVPSTESQSATGEVTTSYTETATTMAIQPRASREDEQDRNTPVGDWVGFGRAADPFTSTCQVVWDGHTFDVVGDPRVEVNQRTGAVSHLEMDLREVT